MRAGISIKGFMAGLRGPATPGRSKRASGPVAKAALACKRRAKQDFARFAAARPGLRDGMRRRDERRSEVEQDFRRGPGDGFRHPGRAAGVGRDLCRRMPPRRWAIWSTSPEEAAGGAAEAGCRPTGARSCRPPTWPPARPPSRAAQACHNIAPGGADGIGPNLYGVVGGPVMHRAGFAYSDAMAAHKAEAPTWGYDQLDQLHHRPGRYVPGTKMSFAGLRDTPTRINLIAYLRTRARPASRSRRPIPRVSRAPPLRPRAPLPPRAQSLPTPRRPRPESRAAPAAGRHRRRDDPDGARRSAGRDQPGSAERLVGSTIHDFGTGGLSGRLFRFRSQRRRKTAGSKPSAAIAGVGLGEGFDRPRAP